MGSQPLQLTPAAAATPTSLEAEIEIFSLTVFCLPPPDPIHDLSLFFKEKRFETLPPTRVSQLGVISTSLPLSQTLPGLTLF